MSIPKELNYGYKIFIDQVVGADDGILWSMFMRRTQDPLYEYQKRRLLDATISLSHIATIEFKWKIGAFFFLFLEWEKKGGYFSPL